MAKNDTGKKVKKTKEKAGAIDPVRFPKKVRRRRQIQRGPHGGMQLLLIEDVMHLGKQGEVVEVKPGYGRNFLIPQGLATQVNAATMVRIEKHKAKVEALRMAKLAELKVIAKKIEKHSVTIEANANEEGHLYGSVTAIDIAKALVKEGFEITPEMVLLEGPLKELALYHVAIRLAEEVRAEVKVWVVPTSEKESK